MSSHLSLSDIHVPSSKSTSTEPELHSRPSTTSEVLADEQDPPNHAIPDKEAQLDARSTLTASSALPPPPDGGLHAWLKVLGGFLIYINIWCVTFPHPTNTQSTPNHRFQGLHTNLRRLPILLQNDSSDFLLPLCHILDRHRASLAAHFNRRAFRSLVRPRILPLDAAGG